MRTVKVILWGTEVGVLFDSPSHPGYYCFRYTDKFLNSHIEMCPLVMKLSPVTYEFNNLNMETFKGLPPLIIDSLPDRYGEALLNIWKDKNNKQTLDPIDVLLYTGKRGMGALEFEPALDDATVMEELEIDSLLEVAKAVLNKRSDVTINIKNEDDLNKLIDVGSSIGGARAKAVIAINEQGEIKSGQIANLKGYKYCILKFDGLSNDFSEDKEITYYTRIEYSYYLMAKAAHINMRNSFLYEKNKRYHFVTERFDRGPDGEKIHMLSLAGMMGYDYKQAGTYAYEDVAKILDILHCGIDDIHQLYRRMIFNVLTKNNDDHIKNISFLMNKKGEWSLSPAYDLSYAYNPNGEWTKHHQMTINHKVDNITYEDLLESAKNMGIKKSKAISIYQEVIEAVHQYEDFAKKAHLPPNLTKILMRRYKEIEKQINNE